MHHNTCIHANTSPCIIKEIIIIKHEIHEKRQVLSDKLALVRAKVQEEAQRKCSPQSFLSCDSNYLKSFWRIDGINVHVIDENPFSVEEWSITKVAVFCGAKVGAKFIKATIFSPRNIGLFIAEMDTATCIRHPNIQQFIGASLDYDYPVVITELMQTNLQSVRHTLSCDHVVSISTDIACALSYLHQIRPEPVIHQHVNSANVLLEVFGSGSWRAKLSAYGSANFISKVTMKYSEFYTAPESSNPKKQSPKMDVYSYGILLLEMATGKFPDPKLQAQQLETLVWQELAPLIRRCISEDPIKRPNMKDVVILLPGVEASLNRKRN